MIRLASLLILLGLVPIARVLWDPTGPNAIHSTFFGMPAVGAGIVLYLATRVFGGRSTR